MAPHKARSLARFEDHLGSVEVYELNGYRSLCFTDQPELTQGSMSLTTELGFRAEYLKQHLTAALAAEGPERVLCLGLGIGALPRLLRAIWPRIEIDAVERQPAVFAAANQYFGLRLDAHFRVHFAGAETFIQRADQRHQYDLVFVDCYNGRGIAPRCANIDFYRQVSACLRKGGFLVTNVIKNRYGGREALQSSLSILDSPWALPALERSNFTVFGHPFAKVPLANLARQIRRIDQSRILPFKLSQELERIVPARTLFAGRRQSQRRGL